MQADTANIEQTSRAPTAKKANGKHRPRSIADLDHRTLDKLDRRCVTYQRYEAIRTALVADLGGDAVVSTAEAQITDKSAFIAMTLEQMQISALAGEKIDLQRYGELTDRLRRLFETVGLERRQRDVTPSIEQFINDIQAHKNAEKAAGESNLPEPQS